MDGFVVWLIIITICLLGWIPIDTFLNGIAKIVNAFKNKSNEKHDEKKG